VAPPQPDFDVIRAEFELPTGFPADVLAEAERAAAGHPPGQRLDATDIELVTIDPPGSKDLDQAVGVTRRGEGFRVHYAIADLGAVVAPGGALDAEVRRRGQTIYLPDASVPLHPPVLSEGAASLLPDGPRPAVLWRIDLDVAGEPTDVEVRRAVVRSRAQLDYAGVQADLEAGRLHPALVALPELGPLRRAAAVARGAIELELPEQEVQPDGDGGWSVVLRHRVDVEAWNAEISLLTGMCAAKIMLDAGVGVLRTLPAPPPDAVVELRRTALSLGVDWPAGAPPAQVLSGLDRSAPRALALLRAATRLLRGAGYLALGGERVAPEHTGHAGIGAPYAHVTAPLRRLVDRFGTEVCLAATAGVEAPAWLRAALPELPSTMASSDALAAKVDRACLDLTEAVALAGRVGERFDAVVLAEAAAGESGEVFVLDPPVLGPCAGPLRAGARLAVRLVQADPEARKVTFAVE